MTVFKKLITGFTAAALLCGSATAAYADRYDRHDRYDRYHRHDRGHHRGHYKHRDYVVVHRAPRTVIVQEPAYYAQSAYDSRVVCYSQRNPLPILLGGAVGGLAGSTIGKGSGRTAAIITGAVLGAGVGSSYTYSDQVCTREAFETVPIGQPVYWQNGEYDYNVVPTKEYRTAGRYCREYQAVATVGQRRQETYGTACRQPDGSWEIVN